MTSNTALSGSCLAWYPVLRTASSRLSHGFSPRVLTRTRATSLLPSTSSTSAHTTPGTARKALRTRLTPALMLTADPGPAVTSRPTSRARLLDDMDDDSVRRGVPPAPQPLWWEVSDASRGRSVWRKEAS
jgi:hypothetical protein